MLPVAALEEAATDASGQLANETNAMNAADDLPARSLLWLTLAQAFLAPSRPEVARCFVDGLADDLEDLIIGLGLELNDELAALRSACQRFNGAESLLVEYSRLFLQPPALATLNLARYVDGSSNGACVDALEVAYAQAGLAPSERLRDLPDHLSRQMECLGWLAGSGHATDAAEFADLCLLGALPCLARQLEERAPDSPYTALARIAAKAIGRAQPMPKPATRDRSGRHDTSIGVWRHCQNCDKPYAREKELKVMARALKEAGLPDDHLSLCPECRDVQKSFFKRTIG